jgi:acyl-CoA thioesterase
MVRGEVHPVNRRQGENGLGAPIVPPWGMLEPGTMSALDDDSALEPIGPHRFRTQITDRWSIGTAPNGGYLAVIATKSIAASLPHPHPFSVTTHFLSTAKPGPAEVAVEVVRTGRGHSTGQASLLQDGKEILRTLAVFGDLATVGGPTHVTVASHELPPPEECERGRAGPTSALSIADRVDVAMRPGAVSWMPGPDGAARVRSERAILDGWVRLRDGSEPDPISLVFFADAFPPPVLNLSSVRTPWVPTLELTVHVRGIPAPGMLAARFTTRALVDGYLEEDGEIWDSAGKLVALSRQLARVQRMG